MESYRGNDVKNHFILEGDEEKIFQSYKSICAIWEYDSLTLGRDCFYSRTTIKYLYKFIREETPFNNIDRKIILKAKKEGKLELDGYFIVYDENLF